MSLPICFDRIPCFIRQGKYSWCFDYHMKSIIKLEWKQISTMARNLSDSVNPAAYKMLCPLKWYSFYAITNPNFIPERYPKVSGLFSGLDRGKVSGINDWSRFGTHFRVGPLRSSVWFWPLPSYRIERSRLIPLLIEGSRPINPPSPGESLLMGVQKPHSVRSHPFL